MDSKNLLSFEVLIRELFDSFCMNFILRTTVLRISFMADFQSEEPNGLGIILNA